MVSTCVVLIRLLFLIVVSVLVSFYFTAHALMVQSRAELVVGLVFGLSRCGSVAVHLLAASVPSVAGGVGLAPDLAQVRPTLQPGS